MCLVGVVFSVVLELNTFKRLQQRIIICRVPVVWRGIPNCPKLGTRQILDALIPKMCLFGVVFSVALELYTFKHFQQRIIICRVAWRGISNFPKLGTGHLFDALIPKMCLVGVVLLVVLQLYTCQHLQQRIITCGIVCRWHFDLPHNDDYLMRWFPRMCLFGVVFPVALELYIFTFIHLLIWLSNFYFSLHIHF